MNLNNNKTKMQMTIDDLIKQELLKECLAVTRKLRNKQEKKDKKRKFSLELEVEIETKLKAIGYSGVNLQHIKDILSIISDAPELKGSPMIQADLLSVVVIDANPNGTHAYTLGVPCIASNPKDYYVLHSDGMPTQWRYTMADKPRFATDAEIESCINNLNDKQLVTIKTHANFKPFMDSVMKKQFNIASESGGPDEPESNGESNHEIELADGRTIST